MSSTNKKGAGLILSLLTAVAGAVGLGFCIVNAGTDSFRKIGTSPVVIGCAVIAILALVLRVVLVRAHQVQVLVVQAGHQRRADWIVWMRPSLSFTRSM